MNRIIRFCLLFVLVSCQSDQVNDSSHIKEEDVVKILMENGVDLKETAFSKNNSFGSELNNVKPSSYSISGKAIYIYEFKTEEACEKGIKEFNKKTESTDLVSYSKFIKRNALIFYVHEQDLNSEIIPFKKEIQEGLNSLIEG